MVSPSTPDTYITVVHPSDKFAYIQQNAHYNIGGKFDFSRQYVPSRENGSALQVIGNAELTINNLQRVFSVSLISTVSLYSSLDMFLKQQTWQDLSVVSPAGKFHYPKNSYGTIG